MNDNIKHGTWCGWTLAVILAFVVIAGYVAVHAR